MSKRECKADMFLEQIGFTFEGFQRLIIGLCITMLLMFGTIIALIVAFCRLKHPQVSNEYTDNDCCECNNC